MSRYLLDKFLFTVDRDPALVERMLKKLHALVEREMGEDRPPFDLDIFGTRNVMYATPDRG